MAYQIRRTKDIQGRVETIYYQGDMRWTTISEDRKVYDTEDAATSELYHYGGDIIAE
jgi:hypothetical protein